MSTQPGARSGETSALQRAVMFSRARRELRADHRRLTERQIDLLADVVTELRLARIVVGIDVPPDVSTLQRPQGKPAHE